MLVMMICFRYDSECYHVEICLHHDPAVDEQLRTRPLPPGVKAKLCVDHEDPANPTGENWGPGGPGAVVVTATTGQVYNPNFVGSSGSQ